MSKYAPPDDEGRKPFVVTVSDWGRKRTRVVYAADRHGARYAAIGRGGPGTYVTKIRRALADETGVE